MTPGIEMLFLFLMMQKSLLGYYKVRRCGLNLKSKNAQPLCKTQVEKLPCANDRLRFFFSVLMIIVIQVLRSGAHRSRPMRLSVAIFPDSHRTFRT